MQIRRTLKWWYWLAAVLPLGGWLGGWTAGLPIACVAVGAQIAHFAARTGNPGAFSVQVPTAFLGVLVLGAWPPLAFLHWLMLGGTSITLLFDYCVLARTVSLAPWNRTEPLSWRLLRRTYLTPPVRGSFVERSQAPHSTATLPLRRAS